MMNRLFVGIAVRELGAEFSDAELQRVYYNTPALSWNGAYNYVGVATTYYCPQYSYRVYSPANY
jgi:hypothetical protein